MKLSFKTTTLIAAIGMIVYTIYVVVRYAIREFWPTPYYYDLWNDIQERIIIDILPVSLIVAGAGLWKYSPSITASKSFRALTICLFIALIGTLLVSPPAIWAPSNFNEIFGAIFLFSFCAFFITTTIRVISYSIPIGADKLKGIDPNEH